jgi:hypothetical protein
MLAVHSVSVQDRATAIKRISAFIGIELNDKLLETALKQSEKSFMAAHGTKYDEHPLKHARNELAGLPRAAGLGPTSTVRCGA